MDQELQADQVNNSGSGRSRRQKSERVPLAHHENQSSEVTIYIRFVLQEGGDKLGAVRLVTERRLRGCWVSLVVFNALNFMRLINESGQIDCKMEEARL